jgi:hypothetical protein
MDEIIEQAKKEVDEILEREKESFSNKINNYFNESIKELKEKLDNPNSSINKLIHDIEKIFNEKENDGNLRKQIIDLEHMQNPPLINLLFIKDTNPLVNIVLYCLCNIKTLIRYYFNPQREEKILYKEKNDPNNWYLGSSFLELLDNLWKGKKKEYCPEKIHQTLKKLMKDDYATKEPSVIIRYILTKLNEELKDNNKIDDNKDLDDPYDAFNEQKVHDVYWKRFNSEKTKIEVSFYSTTKKIVRCLECRNNPLFSYETSPILNIYLNQENSEILNFEDFKSHLVEKDKEIIEEQCMICLGGELKAKIVNKNIRYTPEVLIININRKKDPNCKISFKYPEQFDIQKIINQEMEISDYHLTTVIKKDNNNFIAFCKNCINKQWYSYNNTKIELVNNYKNYIFDDKKACILIYIGKKK